MNMFNIDRQIADSIAKANKLSITQLGLRFDKVVVRLLGNLRTFVEQSIPKEKIILFTISAPIKLPAKTENQLTGHIKDLFDSGHQDKNLTIFRNKIRLKLIEPSSKQSLKFIGFVHNQSTNSKMLLDLAVQWLDKPDL